MIRSAIVICLFAFVVQSYAQGPPSEAEQKDDSAVRCKLADKLTDALVVREAIKPTDLTGDIVNTTLGQVGQISALSIPRLHVRRASPASPAVLPERTQRSPDSMTFVDTELFRSSAPKLPLLKWGVERKVISNAQPKPGDPGFWENWEEVKETTWRPNPVDFTSTKYKPTRKPSTTVYKVPSYGTTTWTTTETPEFDETKDNPWWSQEGPKPDSYYAKDLRNVSATIDEFVQSKGGIEYFTSKQREIDEAKVDLEIAKNRAKSGENTHPFSKLYSAIRVQLQRFYTWQKGLPRVRQTWVRIVIAMALIIGWLAFGLQFRYMPNPIDEIPFYG